jgi:hypothetical protein
MSALGKRKSTTLLNHLVDHFEKRREKSLLIWIKGTPLYCMKDRVLASGTARGTQVP